MVDPVQLESLISEVRSLFHHLRAAAGEIHGLGQATAGLRGVLESLARHGSQTVPQLARSRPVSRQHIQVLVNELVQRGLVRLTDNPAHRRSRLVSLTDDGKRAQRRMRHLEERLLARLPLTTRAEEVQTASSVLRQIRRALQDPSWRGWVRRVSAGRLKGGMRS